MKKILIVSVALIIAILMIAGCTQQQPMAKSVEKMAEDYNPKINPEDFTPNIDNPYFSLPVGKMMIYEAETEDGLERLEILIPGWTYTIMGVETLAYWNRLYIDDVLAEDTRDYLAQHKNGDVWYFGEHVDNYENGKLANHDGTWFAGEGTAKPGIWMIANPQVGNEFVHEFKGGNNFNIVKIVGVSESITVPAGTYTNCVKTFASAVPAGTTANYYFCKDIADIALEIDLKGPKTQTDTRMELVEVDKNGARDMTEVPSAYAREGVVSRQTQAIDKYNPQINPADFSTNITNKYFSLPIGKKLIFEADTEDGLEKIEIEITGETKIIEGVTTLVYLDTVYRNGQLHEITKDYLAQHKNGDVWYFGENVDNYENGELKDHAGTCR